MSLIFYHFLVDLNDFQFSSHWSWKTELSELFRQIPIHRVLTVDNFAQFRSPASYVDKSDLSRCKSNKVMQFRTGESVVQGFTPFKL